MFAIGKIGMDNDELKPYPQQLVFFAAGEEHPLSLGPQHG